MYLDRIKINPPLLGERPQLEDSGYIFASNEDLSTINTCLQDKNLFMRIHYDECWEVHIGYNEHEDRSFGEALQFEIIDFENGIWNQSLVEYIENIDFESAKLSIDNIHAEIDAFFKQETS